MRHRYFIAPNSPLTDRLKEIGAERKKAGETLLAFIKEIGASQMYGSSPESYRFDFKASSDADPAIWRKTKPYRSEYFFVPKKNTPEGKAMAARIKALPPCPPMDDALRVVPQLPVGFPCVIENGRGYRPFIRYWNPDTETLVVSIPWRDVPAEELAEYVKQAESDERHSWSASLDYAQWQPPKWLIEVKEWEALKLIDDDAAASKEAAA